MPFRRIEVERASIALTSRVFRMGMVREILPREILSREILSECLSVTLRESKRLLRLCSKRVFVMPVRRVERNGERETAGRMQ